MSAESQELTAAEAGISIERQIDIVLQALVAAGGQLQTRDLYYAVERFT